MVGRLEHRFDFIFDVAAERLVGAEEEVHVAFQPKPTPLQHIADGGIGGQAHRLRPDQIADVIGPVGARRRFLAIAAHRRQVHRNAGAARDGPDDSQEGHGAIHAPVPAMARAEVEDFDRAAVLGFQPRLQDRRIAQIFLCRRRLADEFDTPDAFVLTLAVQQGAEDGIAVDPWHAAPDDPGTIVDHRRNLAIADRPEV